MFKKNSRESDSEIKKSRAKKLESDDASGEGQDSLLIKLRTLERRQSMLSGKDVDSAEKTDSVLKEAEELLSDYLEESGSEAILESSVNKEMSALEGKIKETIELIGGEEETQKTKDRGMIRMIRYGRKREEINDLIAKSNDQIDKLRESQKGRPDDANVAQDIARLEKTNTLLLEFLENKVARENPQSFITHWIIKLRNWRKEYDDTGLITTPNVEKVYGAIREKAKRALNDENKVGVFTLLGETGTGKTVAARRIAKEMSGEHNYEFIQAHSRMVPEELIARFGLTVNEVDPQKVPEMIKLAQENFAKDNPGVVGDDKKFAFDTIEQVVKSSAAQKQLETKTIYEPVARAAQEGKVVVIDEFNYLSPETLASLNAFLASEPGKNGVFSMGGRSEQFLVQRGFGIIFTGNIGKNFLNRSKLDQASVNRILTNVYEYQYPDQEINKPLAESIVNPSKNKGYSRDLFDSAVTLLADKKGNVSAPIGAMEKVWNMTRAFSIIQRLNAGEDFRSLGIDADGGLEQKITGFKFESIALSFRQLNSIIEAWRSEGFSQPLDYYLYDMIVRPAFILAPKEAAQILYVFRSWGGLFEGEPWNLIEVDPKSWSIKGLKMINKKDIKYDSKISSVELSDVAQEISGQEIPAYQKFEGDGEEVKKNSERIEMELEEIETNFANAVKEMESVSNLADIICGDK